MKRWVVIVFVAIFTIENALAAGIIHHKGGIHWLAGWVHKAVKPACGKNVRVGMFALLPDSPNDIYVVGDSITNLMEPTELLGNPWVRNRGIGGETTLDILARIDEITAGQPRMVLILAGINDLHQRRRPEEVLDTYHQIVETIAARCPHTRIIVQSTLPINDVIYVERTLPYWPGIHQPTAADVQRLNEGLRATRELRVEYLDLWPAMTADGQLRAEFTNDGLHLNGVGAVAWAAAVQPAINP